MISLPLTLTLRALVFSDPNHIHMHDMFWILQLIRFVINDKNRASHNLPTIMYVVAGPMPSNAIQRRQYQTFTFYYVNIWARFFFASSSSCSATESVLKVLLSSVISLWLYNYKWEKCIHHYCAFKTFDTKLGIISNMVRCPLTKWMTPLLHHNHYYCVFTFCATVWQWLVKKMEYTYLVSNNSYSMHARR